MSFVTESISSGFGLENRVIEQSFLNPNNPYKGYDIDIDSFQNTNQGLEDSNQDGRIPLGMFVFNDDNLAKNNFPDVLSPPFNNFVKFNLVNNGDCKFVEKVLCRFSSSPSSVLYPNDSPIVIKPVGDWNFLSLKTINDGEEILNHYPQEIEYELDSQGMEAYGGRYSYVPFAIENNKGDTVSPSYWNDIYNKLTGSGEINDITRFFGVNETQSSVNQALNSTNSNEMEEFRENRAFYKTGTLSNFDKPHVAMWLNTNEAYSNNRCLVFSNYQIWDNSKLNDYVRSEATNYTFNYLAKDNAHKKGTINDEFNVDESLILENQYRVLNQITKIYDKFNDNKINPYSSLKIRFKMKTTLVLPPGNDIESISENSDLFLTNPLNTSAAPKVEVGILNSQFNEVPNTDTDGLDYSPDYHGLSDDDTDYVTNHPDEQFKSPGSFNSTRFFNAVEFEDKKQTPLGGMTRFQNSIMNEWESFEFDFNLTEEHLNRGEIYGVPYGGAFNDVMNGYPGDIRGGVEILLNTNFANEKPSDSLGQIFFKFGDYQNTNWNNRPNGLYMIPPSIMSAFGQSNQSQIDFDSVFMIHDVTRDGADYMTVISQLGDSSNGQLTGKTTVDDGNGGTKTIFLEAYLMFIGSRQSTKDADKLTVNTNSSIENAGGNDRPHMIVAYWDGEQWTYDIGGNNGGYNPIYEFTPNEECFILARLYANEEGQGITGIDQYISNKTNFPTDGVGNLFLFLQSGNDFQGRVLIDDIECYESYEFNPDVDVRKKISVGNYARADLTKYYDPIIHGENGTDEYKDTQAPLEAQFYFYPKYPINEMFIESLPIYQDFKNGRFYIHDIDWGDGTPNEFVFEPKQIDENTALYHTYTTSGIFEITGTMIRVKVDENDEILGVVHNKKFNLKINVNEGLDEDFEFFGSDGYSFIPYKKTTPIIGGISKQSSYYKKIKRQIGILDDEKINIQFKNKSDKLKTELALLKMENQNDLNLEVLPFYMMERFGGVVEKKIEFPFTKIIWPYDDFNLSDIPFISRDENSQDDENHLIKEIQRNDGLNTAFVEWDVEEQFFNDFSSGGIFSKLEYGKEYTFTIQPDNNTTTLNVMKEIPHFFPSWEEGNQGEIIYNGITPIIEELGKGIGDCDITNVKYYNEPKSIWEMFGFEQEDLNEVGNPINDRYWKNIIPKNYSIFNREGLNGALIDTYSEQEWFDNYYYPVLPRYGQNGKFIQNDFPNNKIPFALNGQITNEDDSSNSLLINILNEKIESDVFQDKSGNENIGVAIKDFSVDFDDETLRVKKSKIRSIVKTSNQNGAF